MLHAEKNQRNQSINISLKINNPPQTTWILISNYQVSLKLNETEKFQKEKNLKTTLILNNIPM